MPDPAPELPPDTSPEALHPGLLDRLRRRRQRLWRRTRRVVRWTVGTAIVLAAGALIASRSPLVGMVLRSNLAALVSARAEFDRAIIDLDGRLVISNLRITSTALPGEAGQLLTATTAVVELDWSDVFSGVVTPLAVRLDQPSILLSQSSVDQSLNLAAIGVSGPANTGVSALPPEVTISAGTLVFAEHDAAGAVTPLRVLRVNGSLLPTRTARPAYLIAVSETDAGVLTGAPGGAGSTPAQRARRGMVLSGNIDLADGSAALRLHDLALDQWPPSAVPSAYREIWSRLNLRGDISHIILTSSRASGVVVELAFRDIAMSALIPSQPGPVAPADNQLPPAPLPTPTDLALVGVSGSIRIGREGLSARVEGRIDGQPGLSSVDLRTTGLSAAAPLTCSIQAAGLRLTNDPALLAYIPAVVREYLTIFSGPTGDLNITATISRGSPVNDQPGPLSVSGGIRMRNGVAAFHKFPYRFTDISGQITFDDTRLIFTDIRGRGPTGAKLSARGVVTPLTPEARVDVEVNVADLPVDDHLLAAMSEDRRAALRSLADRTVYDRLLAAGLIREPGRPGADGTFFAPPLPFAGDADVAVRVRRELGPEDDWTTAIDARFSEIGLLNPTFPLPVIGRNVRFRITDITAELLGGSFVGLRGGSVDAEAKVVFFRDDVKVFEPRVELTASKLPVDELMLAAIRGGPSRQADPPPANAAAANAPAADDGASLFTGALDRLQLAGAVSGHALVTGEPQPDGTPAPLDYVVSVDLSDLRAVVGSAADVQAIGPLALADFTGQVRLSSQRVRVNNLQARLVRTGGDAGPTPPTDAIGPFLPAGNADAGVFALNLNAALPGAPDQGLLEARLGVLGLSLADPIEEVLAVLSPAAAEWITDLRRQRRPTGTVDLEAVAQRPSDASVDQMPDIRVALTRVHGAELAALDGRLAIDADDGAVTAHVPPDGPLQLTADSFAADIAFDQQSVGRLSASGSITVDLPTQRIITPAQISVAIDGCAFEAPVIPPALRALAGPSAADRFTDLAPFGRFDALLRLSDLTLPPGSEPTISAIVSPKDLAFARGDHRIRFPDVNGQIEVDAPSSAIPDARITGRVVDLQLRAPEWGARVDGTFTVAVPPGDAQAVQAPQSPPPPTLALDLSVSLSAERFNDDLRALIPQSARRMLDNIELVIEGPVDVVDARLLSAPDGSPRFDGTIDFARAQLNPGLPIDNASGSIAIHAFIDAAGRESARIELDAHRLWVRGVALTDLYVDAIADDTSGAVIVSNASATCHGGRLLATGSLAPRDAASPATISDSPRIYRFEVLASDLAFASLLDDLTVAASPTPFVGPRQDLLANPDLSRGRLDARLGVAGMLGDPASRVGSGAVRISEGNVLRLPVLYPLMQLSNLVIPSDDQLRHAEAEFFIDADRVVFERAVASGDTIALHGSGQMTLPDAELDFSFNSRAINRVPLVSWLWETVRNEIVTTTITGTLDQPAVASRSLSGFQRLFASILGDDRAPGAPAAARRPASSEVRLQRHTPPPPPNPVAGVPADDDE